ncbi:Squalene/phytoene synthase [Corchorus olitorius]|uniref:Squalene/phytoene synthase n=1 Tax=Corchorus olitorius TaxID=93759 RepID=A0A1R3GRE0_9ROSI|nr:Squalene/phytoene synthase [Corchorus olitorius]
MGTLGALVKHPDDFYPLLKLKMAARHAEKQIPSEPYWGFCFSMLHKVSRSFALVIQQLDTKLENAVCIFYLVLRALDTVEDDTSIATDVKVPILIAFHRHIYDRSWHFSCGTKDYKVMDQFHHVSTAFLELEKGYQEAIEDITKRMAIACTVGHLSVEVMKLVNNLMKAPEVAVTMQEFSKEMTKENQVMALKEKGIAAEFLSSTQTSQIHEDLNSDSVTDMLFLYQDLYSQNFYVKLPDLFALFLYLSIIGLATVSFIFE